MPRCFCVAVGSLAPLVAVLDVGRLAEGAVSGMLGRGYTRHLTTFMVPPRRETKARDADRPAPAPPPGSGSDAERRTSGRLLVRAVTIAPRNENEIANRFTIRSETQEQLTMGWILSWIRIMSPSSCLHDRSSPAISISCESVGSVGLCFTAAAHKKWTSRTLDASRCR